MRGSVNAPAPGGVRPGVAPADDLDGVEGKNLPNVSVVVPVLNAVETIEPCVRAILSQDYPRARFEALFTDNGSTDGTLQVLHGLKDGIVVLNEQRLGSSAARNRGTKAAKHDLIAFTDADCIPEPNWLRNLVAGAQAHSGVDFFGGKILASDPSSRIQRYSERLFDQDAAINRFTPRYAITANLLARKQALSRIGYFDEAFPRAQDVDLFYRGQFGKGLRLEYVDAAVVRHFNPSSVGALFAKGVQHGMGTAYIYKRYAKELRIRRGVQCLFADRYPKIAMSLGRYAMRRLEHVSGMRGWSDDDLHYPLYDAVFNAGKQLGLVGATVKDVLHGCGRAGPVDGWRAS